MTSPTRAHAAAAAGSLAASRETHEDGLGAHIDVGGTLVTGAMDVFSTLESNVRSYCRSWPVVFDVARGSRVWTEDGREFLDFFSGAGALNYGHNNPTLKAALLTFLERDGILHGLDAHTKTKRDLLETLQRVILAPRGLQYRVMFPGPTGTNAVEASLKIARKVTGRSTIAHFSGSFHGVTLGALALTSNRVNRAAAGVPLLHGLTLPFDDPAVSVAEALDEVDRRLAAAGTGLRQPAAVILETVQGEGGVRVARTDWLRGVAALCRDRGILVIVDDIQMGCGRTGDFFSFEPAGIRPDIVTLSKSISGYGLPMALVLIRPDLDAWEPGEHNGTFRGNNAAFVTATAALDHYWTDDSLKRRVIGAGNRMQAALTSIVDATGADTSAISGRGLAQGFTIGDPVAATRVRDKAFESGLLVETCGPNGETIKLLPSLLTTAADLDLGCDVLADAITCSI